MKRREGKRKGGKGRVKERGEGRRMGRRLKYGEGEGKIGVRLQVSESSLCPQGVQQSLAALCKGSLAEVMHTHLGAGPRAQPA